MFGSLHGRGLEAGRFHMVTNFPRDALHRADIVIGPAISTRNRDSSTSARNYDIHRCKCIELDNLWHNPVVGSTLLTGCRRNGSTILDDWRPSHVRFV